MRGCIRLISSSASVVTIANDCSNWRARPFLIFPGVPQTRKGEGAPACQLESVWLLGGLLFRVE